jgi:signal transduction histidine kinase/ligand-binding sensor domain-containing protein
MTHARLKLALLQGAILASSSPLAPGEPTKSGVSPPPFVRYSLTEGLSQTNVQAIHQDRRGLLWFGTADGLNRFDGYSFTVLRNSRRDSTSLSENGVWALCEDSLGGLWVGTLASGLNRLDLWSGRIRRYDRLLPDNRVRALCADHLGRLWVGMQQGGLAMFDPASGTLATFTSDPDDLHSLPSNTVRALQPDNTGLWIGTDGAGLCRLRWDDLERDNARFLRARDMGIDRKFLTRTTELARDREGGLWVGTTNQGAARITFSPAGTAVVQRFVSSPSDPASITGDVVYSVAQDSTGTVWIGTWEGLNRLEPNAAAPSGYRITRLLHDPYNPSSLPGNAVYSLMTDQGGLLWIGTNGAGLARFNATIQRFLLYQHDPRRPKPFPPGPVRAIVAGDAGFWVGTTGGGLAWVSDSGGVVLRFSAVPGNPRSLSGNDVRAVLVDMRGDVWVGTYGGGLNRLTMDGRDRRTPGGKRSPPTHGWKISRIDTSALGSAQVFAMRQDRRGRYWVATQNGLVRCQGVDASGTKLQSATSFTFARGRPGGLSHPIVRMLFEDSRGCIWAGTYGGLDHICPGSDSVHTFRPDSLRPGSISHKVAVSAAEDEDGFLWFGTFGGGLNRYDPRDGTFTVLDEEHGLPNSYVYGILADDDGYLWLSTNRGITRFARRQWRPNMPPDSAARLLREFDVRDGLQSNEFNAGAVEKGPDGTLYFGGVAGLNRFDPRTVGETGFPPAVVVSSFSLSGYPVNLDSSLSTSGTLTLSHGQNNFAFEVASLDFANPDRNRYAFKLEGLDDDWVPSGHSRRAMYTSIDHGFYVFRARGTNADGVWSARELSIPILIQPPFWHTWWFRLGMLAMLAGAASVVVLSRKRTADQARKAERLFLRQLIESQENERKRIAGELHDGLGQHLLIIRNRALLGIDPQGDAREQLREISALAGQTINDVRGMAYGLRPYQLDRLGLTKAIEAVCREAMQASRVTLAQSIDNIDGLLPEGMEINLYRIVQEAMTNMIKHSGATEATVSLQSSDSGITLMISDNGRGFDGGTASAGRGAGHGLSGIKERARILGGEADIRSGAGSGTIVTVSIPIGRGKR